jgi:hypothetical protein
VIILAKLITYDLCAPGKNYEDLITAIKTYPMWCKITESCWIVSSLSTCSETATYLRQFIDDNDKLFVAMLSGDAAWIKLISPDEAVQNLLKQ